MSKPLWLEDIRNAVQQIFNSLSFFKGSLSLVNSIFKNLLVSFILRCCVWVCFSTIITLFLIILSYKSYNWCFRYKSINYFCCAYPGHRLDFFCCWYISSVFSAYEHPQLLMQLPRQNERICLNIDKTAQSSVHLLSDPEQGEWATLPQYQDKESHWVCECSWCLWE